MSVIIKGMELPLPGDVMVCALIDGKLQCSIVTRNKPIEWREVLETPTPHGRLIDADELKKKLEKHREMCGDIELAHGIDEAIRILENATIIIEAEVSE